MQINVPPISCSKMVSFNIMPSEQLILNFWLCNMAFCSHLMETQCLSSKQERMFLPLCLMLKWVIYYFPIHDFQKDFHFKAKRIIFRFFFSPESQNGGFLFNVDWGRHCEMDRNSKPNEYLKWLCYSCFHAMAHVINHGSREARTPLAGAHHSTFPP